MEYNKNMLITDDGTNLVSQSLQEGQKVNFDAMIITDTPLPTDRQLSAMTIDNFKNMRKYPIATLKKGSNSVQPEAKLDNDGLTEDYPIHAIGLLAHVGESNSKLFGITQNSEGTPAILTKQSQTPYFITYDMAITFTNPDRYTATITPAGYVDQTTFDEEIGKIQTSIKSIDLSDAVKKANAYTDSQINSINGSDSTINQNIAQAKTESISHSDSNRDNLQKQLNGKQPSGNYVSQDDFNSVKNAMNVNDPNSSFNVSLNNKIQDANNYASNLVDKSHDQLSSDIQSSEQRSKSYADSKIKFFNSLDEINNTTAPEGTIAIAKE